jgi:dipeptidyl aminopeptidase/acylaminoacyl peptidase
MTDPIAPADKPPVRRRFAGGRMSAAPALSLVGLLVAGLLTAQVYLNWTPTLSSSAEATPTATPVPVASGQTPTPAPTGTIATNPEISVPGMLVYAKSGVLWLQSGTTAHQLTQSVSGSQQSQPAFSPDGQWVYYIDTRVTTGRWYDDQGYYDAFTLNYPVLCRIHPDGTGKKDVLSSLIRQGSGRIFFWIMQPSISPNGSTAAVASDGPTVPTVQDVMIHYVNTTTGKLAPALPLRDVPLLGLSDPAFSPDGRSLAYTMEGVTHNYGTPSIWIYSGGAPRELAAGYRAASWSPDGKYVAATKVAGNTLNVAVLDVATGKQVAQVTTDGASWGPVWSPDGDKLVYMHLTGAIVDLNMVYISGSGATMTFKIEPNLTDYSGLDGGSTPAWYIPGYGPPAPTPTPTAASSCSSGSPAPSACGSGSATALPTPS